MKTILTVPAPGGIMPADDSYTVLRRKCVPIESIDSGIRGLAKELCELMDVEHQGLIIVGISAPQVGERHIKKRAKKDTSPSIVSLRGLEDL